MIIVLSIIGLIAIVLLIGRVNLSLQFTKEVKQLFSESKNVSDKTFKYGQLAGLPEPVQRYFQTRFKKWAALH
jgi:hypothetical protein